MTDLVGHDSKAGIKIETADYGSTAIALGAGNLLPVLTSGIAQTKSFEQNETLEGQGGQKAPIVTGVRNRGVVTLRSLYEGLEPILAMGMGMENQDNSPINVTGSVYKHLFEMSSDVLQKMAYNYKHMASPSGSRVPHGTYCIDVQVDPIFEFLSTKVNQFILSVDSNGSMRVSADMVAHSVDRSSSTNTASTLWDYTNKSEVVAFEDMVFRLKPVYEMKLTSSEDQMRIIEDTAGTPANVDISLSFDGTVSYSPQKVAKLIEKALNAGTQHSIIYEVTVNESNLKMTIRNTNTAHLIQVDVSEGDNLDRMCGFIDDPTAATSITGQCGMMTYQSKLSSSYEYSLAGFTLTVNNNLVTDDQTSGSGLLIEEPLRNGTYSIGLDLRFQRYNSANKVLFEHIDYDAKLMGDIFFTGSTIESGETYKFNIYMPDMHVINSNVNVNDPGVQRPRMQLVLNDPEVDTHYGWNGGTDTADSELESFKIIQSVDLAYDDVRCFAVFKGKLYAGTGNTDAILCQFDFENGWNSHASFPYDITGYKNIRAMAVFGDKLYMACLNDASADTHIFEWDGDIDSSNPDDSDVETVAGQAATCMLSSKVAGLLLVGFNDGDIYSSSDGTTYTIRQTGGAGTMTFVYDMKENSSTIYAAGVSGVNSILRKSTNGTTWSNWNSTTGSGFTSIVCVNDWVFASHSDSSTHGVVMYNTDTSGTLAEKADMTDASLGVGTEGAMDMIFYNGWIYCGWEGASGAELIATDLAHIGSNIYLVKGISGETSVNKFIVYEDVLFMGTEGGAEIWMRLPFSALSIENQNKNSSNLL